MAKKKVQKDKQRSTKHTYKIEYQSLLNYLAFQYFDIERT